MMYSIVLSNGSSTTSRMGQQWLRESDVREGEENKTPMELSRSDLADLFTCLNTTVTPSLSLTASNTLCLYGL